MATLVGNGAYVVINTINMSAYWTSVKPKGKNQVRDVSAGSNLTHVQRSAGLNDYSFDCIFVYDTPNVSTYLQQLKPGTKYTFEYGPEGNVSGKPHHQQTVIVDNVSHEIKVDKDKVAFAVLLSGADVPTVDMYAGGVYP